MGVDTRCAHHGSARKKQGARDVKIEGMALAGSTEIISTKKRGDLQKTKLKVMDMGPEASGGDLYWIDFLGEAALSDEELVAILRQPVVIEVRRIYISTGNQPGRSYLNASGGAVLQDGQIVQSGLRSQRLARAS
jgi:hypothetical protein